VRRSELATTSILCFPSANNEHCEGGWPQGQPRRLLDDPHAISNVQPPFDAGGIAGAAGGAESLGTTWLCTTGKNSVPPCVRLLNNPEVTINQATGEGKAELDLRNQTDKEASVALVATMSTSGNSSVYATFTSETQTHPKRSYETVLPPKTSSIVKVTVHDDWDDAELDLEIANHYGAESTIPSKTSKWANESSR
jgi:hypothetical protein